MATWAAALSTVRTGVATVLDTALSDVNVYAYMPSQPQLPAACVMPDTFTTASAFGGLMKLDLRIWLFSAGGDLPGTQQALDSLLGRVAKALQDAPTLGASVSNSNVRGFTSYATEVSVSGESAYAVAIEVETWVDVT